MKLLSKEEKSAIRTARKILRRISKKMTDLEDAAWEGGSDENALLDQYYKQLNKMNIGFDPTACEAYIMT